VTTSQVTGVQVSILTSRRVNVVLSDHKSSDRRYRKRTDKHSSSWCQRKGVVTPSEVKEVVVCLQPGIIAQDVAEVSTEATKCSESENSVMVL
jgi:hypothetical protein